MSLKEPEIKQYTNSEGQRIENDLLLRALDYEETERHPVWMMRQAGRYLPEYMAIREKMSFLELCKDPKKAAEVSIQPLRIVGVDAIIMFSDILIPLEPMGAPVSFSTGKPKFGDPIRTKEQVEKLIVPDLAKECDYVFETIKEIKKQITKDGVQEVPVLGFAGAPWTMASYLIEGGGSQHYAEIKKFMYQEEDAMHELLEMLSETVAQHLILKLDHGADMVQLFDTWASQLSRDDFEIYALPYQRKIIEKIKAKHPDKKVTLYVNGVSHIFDLMLKSGADVLSIDWRADLKATREILKAYNQAHGTKVAVQGNFDPCFLLGTKESVLKKTLAMLDEAGRESGYIANLGHGILPNVPVENAKAFIETVRSYKFASEPRYAHPHDTH